MESILLEKLNDKQYNGLIKTLDCLALHPYSALEKDFILKYRRQLAAQTEIQKLPEVTLKLPPEFRIFKAYLTL